LFLGHELIKQNESTTHYYFYIRKSW
jgi:hypothetical protein